MNPNGIQFNITNLTVRGLLLELIFQNAVDVLSFNGTYLIPGTLGISHEDLGRSMKP